MALLIRGVRVLSAISRVGGMTRSSVRAGVVPERLRPCGSRASSIARVDAVVPLAAVLAGLSLRG